MAKNKNMTRYRKCWDLQTMTLSYAILVAMISGATILSGVGAGLYLLIMRNSYSGSDLAMFCMIVASCTVPCLLIFPYNVMLIIGVCKKNPKQLLIYFVFGIIQSIILVIGSITYMIKEDGHLYSTIAFVISLITVLGLICVWITYKRLKMRADHGMFDQQHVLYMMAT